LRVPPGVEGTVIDVKVFSRSGIRKDKRYKEIVQSETLRIEDNFAHHVGVLRVGIKEKLIEMLSGVSIINGSKKEILKSFQLNNMDVDQLFDLIVQDKEINVDLNTLKEMYSNQQHVLAALKIDKINQLRKGDELPSGVIKMIKVYVANKRHVSVGDKMAGRHGNKGVVSCIVNPEDMPYLADGTPVDIVLNPLGVPGRMNVGQILETVLGFVGKSAKIFQKKLMI